ncbi:hypothetical protein CVT26_001026 [Gymnopilus dilepis]|uniref:Uncharacterized protein n=1 Tax=Gymnopilus dilepis TaxID=231916 RepID=A0A409Y293_9AGAR|nr:hypothetical protein CVT26_001026 [Gymnopilus dilepis]
MAVNHMDERGEFPALPFKLLQSVHISLKEGEALGAIQEAMIDSREQYGLPNSDAFDGDWETMRIGRKRGGSEVSKSSHASSGRDESPSKVQRMVGDG